MVIQAAIVSIFVLLSAYYFIKGMIKGYRNIQKEKALNGEYGNETMWASELIEEGDELFIVAVNTLPKTEMTEVGIIAESKEELRELAVERFEKQENTNAPIPEEFSQ